MFGLAAQQGMPEAKMPLVVALAAVPTNVFHSIYKRIPQIQGNAYGSNSHAHPLTRAHPQTAHDELRCFGTAT